MKGGPKRIGGVPMRMPRTFVVASLPILAYAATATAHPPEIDGLRLTHVAVANPKVTGNSAPNVLSPELVEIIVAQGSTPVENPASVMVGSSSIDIMFYGYQGSAPMFPPPGATPAAGQPPIEAQKTEPDKN